MRIQIHYSSWPDFDPATHAPAADRIGREGGVDHRVKPGDDDLNRPAVVGKAGHNG
jgi:hypothetical protein